MAVYSHQNVSLMTNDTFSPLRFIFREHLSHKTTFFSLAKQVAAQTGFTVDVTINNSSHYHSKPV